MLLKINGTFEKIAGMKKLVFILILSVVGSFGNSFTSYSSSPVKHDITELSNKEKKKSIEKTSVQLVLKKVKWGAYKYSRKKRPKSTEVQSILIQRESISQNCIFKEKIILPIQIGYSPFIDNDNNRAPPLYC